jgi:hypothetical protein
MNAPLLSFSFSFSFSPSLLLSLSISLSPLLYLSFLPCHDAFLPFYRPQQAIDDIYANGKPYIGSGKLEGKKAIITGGDSGIGRATAILFAIEGADSTISYLPSEEQDAQDTKAYVEKKTNGARTLHLIQADLKLEANAIKVIEAHMARWGRLDILVNNAAQQLENHDITTLDSKQWEEWVVSL